MPQFQIQLGNETQAFSDLPEFARGYIEAMFFTETGEPDGPLENVTFADFDKDTLAAILIGCHAFQVANAELLDAAYRRLDYSPEQAGRDYWFTRCGHGVGFWDRDLGEIGEALTNAANRNGEVWPYVGDDGRIYI
jgi:hypothetical protein